MKIDHIEFIKNVNTKEQLFERISKIWKEKGYVESEEEFLESLKEREILNSTGFVEGFAIPHGKSSTVKKPGILFIRLEDGLEWETMDNQKIDCIFSLAIPGENSGDEHLENLAKISRKLISEEFRNEIKTSKDIDSLSMVLKEI